MTLAQTQNRLSLRLRIIFIGVIAAVGSSAAHAHKVSSASLILYLNTEEERTFQVSTQMEIESSGDAALDDEIGPEDAARTFVKNQLLVLIDEKEQPHQIITELIDESDEETPEELRRLSVLVTWDGKLPDDGKELSLYLKETSEMSIVIATVKNGIAARRVQVMFAGEYSRGENIEPLVKGNPFEEANPLVEKVVEPVVEEEEVGATNLYRAFEAGLNGALQNMLLPLALLLSLILLRGSFRALLYPFVMFVIAHSLGMSLAAFGLIDHFPWALFVSLGALITLAVDNLFSFKFRWWRYLAGAAGGFFLGNDMAQAGALLILGGSPVDFRVFVPFLFGFDLALLAMVLTLGGLITLFGRKASFRWAVVIPLSIICAGLALSLIAQASPDIESYFK